MSLQVHIESIQESFLAPARPGYAPPAGPRFGLRSSVGMGLSTATDTAPCALDQVHGPEDAIEALPDRESEYPGAVLPPPLPFPYPRGLPRIFVTTVLS